MKPIYLSAALAAVALSLSGPLARAQTNEITVGISISTTGPAAALGVPERNALEFVPKEIGGVPLKLIVLDDGGDPTNATTNARRFVTESKADVIIGTDQRTGELRLFFGEAALRSIAGSGMSEHLVVLEVPVDFSTRDADALAEACLARKGSTCYPFGGRG